MCGRYLRHSDKQRIAEAFHLKDLPEHLVLAPDYNIAPTTFQPVIRLGRDTGQRELVPMRWGLMPNFANALRDFKGMTTFNARAEAILSSGTWKLPFQRRRCLVPADGFYEWRKPETPKGRKQPFAFSLATRQPLAFAGIWDAWKEPKSSPQTTDTWLQSFAIVTTGANEIMAPVHDRMPVILHPRDYDRWLDRGEVELPPIDLLRPFEAEEMRAEPCNPAVGNVKNNGPEMLNSV